MFAAETLFAQTETVLHSFNQNGTDGYEPLASLTQQDGKLYGTTYGGGSYGNYGTVFELTPSSRGWTERVLYSFAGGSDGANPRYSSVVFDAMGNMYGTTQGGGTSGNGTVFKLIPSGSGWTESVLYSFTGGSDGGDAVSNVIFDKAGNLYGTTGGAAISPAVPRMVAEQLLNSVPKPTELGRKAYFMRLLAAAMEAFPWQAWPSMPRVISTGRRPTVGPERVTSTDSPVAEPSLS
jgi:uncharacterized repeat protein (TIGR03803 family)